MALKLQKKAGQIDKKLFRKQWKLEDIESGLAHFFDKYKRYPTAHEFDAYPYLPSGRTIQRSFGGLIGLRKVLKLEGQGDFRKGQYSTDRAFKINKRAHSVENIVYEFLVEKFGKQFVHREYFFTDDKRTRADFFVYDDAGGICIDVFYPSNRMNVIGCLNNKLQKYKAEYMRQYPVIFLQMNHDIDQGVLDQVVQNKRRSLAVGQQLMSWGVFKDFCKSKKRLHVK